MNDPSLERPTEVLACCLLAVNKIYLELLTEEVPKALFKEAGKTVRCLARCLSGISDTEVEDYVAELDDDHSA